MKLQFAWPCVLLMGLLTAGDDVRAGGPGTTTPLIIGMPETMLLDVAEGERGLLGKNLASLMKEFTGLRGELKIVKGPFELANEMDAKKTHLGIFQGVEFAWVQQKHPNLKPLMVSTSDEKEKRHIFALLLVRQDSGHKDFADLKGKSVAVPKKTKEHVRLFLEQNAGGDPKDFFKSVVAAGSTEKALDELLTGKVDAVVTDKVGVDFYARTKPGAFRQMAVARKSAPFPLGVVVYREGVLDQATLNRIQKGMLKANQSERGQDLMAQWDLISFEPVFKEFQADLEAIRKQYPGPKAK